MAAAVVAAVLLVGCLVEVFADPLGIAPEMLPILDQRASVVGVVIAAACLAVAMIALLVQVRDGRTVQDPPALRPAPVTTPKGPPGQAAGVRKADGAGADEPRTYRGDHIDFHHNTIHGPVIGKYVGGPRTGPVHPQPGERR